MAYLVPRENPANSSGAAPAHGPSAHGSQATLADLSLRLLIDSVCDHAVFTLDADGCLADWNDGGQRLFGYAAAEMAGKPVRVLFTPEDQARERSVHLLDGAARSGRATAVIWCRRRDGRRFPAQVEIRAAPDGDGGLLGFACGVRDLSEERELGRLRRDGAAAGGEETGGTALLSMISHEIRTPLTGIKGFTDVLALQDLSPLQRRYVELAAASCGALMAVVDDLLDYSALEAGDLELRTEPFTVAALAHNVLSMVLGSAAPKRLALSLSIAPNVPATIVGDRGRVRQVLLNLLANAVKFTLRGSVRLSITAEKATDGGETLKFAVVDTGIGIPEDRLSRLFNPFSQADASIKDRFGGSGLGLAICKQLVERMGGRIGVETALGHGSTFWFTIQLARAAAVPAGSPARPQGAVPSRGIRVLLVDDGRMNQEIARVFLEHAGYDVCVVDSGAAALECLDAQAFDIVLMDLQMPVMDGLETTRRVRARGGRFAELPIIALSARVFSDDVAACLAAGMNGHLGKPFDHAEMVEAVERFTSARSA